MHVFQHFDRNCRRCWRSSACFNVFSEIVPDDEEDARVSTRFPEFSQKLRVFKYVFRNYSRCCRSWSCFKVFSEITAGG